MNMQEINELVRVTPTRGPTPLGEGTGDLQMRHELDLVVQHQVAEQS